MGVLAYAAETRRQIIIACTCVSSGVRSAATLTATWTPPVGPVRKELRSWQPTMKWTVSFAGYRPPVFACCLLLCTCYYHGPVDCYCLPACCFLLCACCFLLFCCCLPVVCCCVHVCCCTCCLLLPACCFLLCSCCLM